MSNPETKPDREQVSRRYAELAARLGDLELRLHLTKAHLTDLQTQKQSLLSELLLLNAQAGAK